MEANEVPERLYLSQEKDRNGCYIDLMWHKHPYENMENVEYIRKDAFIEKACEWIKENITNNPNANSILVRNGCVTLGMLVENFKKYMED